MSRLPLQYFGRSSQMSSSEIKPQRSASITPAPVKDAFDDGLFADFYDALFSGITQNTDPLPFANSSGLGGPPDPPNQSSSSAAGAPSPPLQSVSPQSSSQSASKSTSLLNAVSALGGSSQSASRHQLQQQQPIPQKSTDLVLAPYELGLDVNFYVSRLNAYIGQAITRNIYILDVSTGTGRVLAEILTLLSSSRIKQRLHFVGTDSHESMLSRARLKIHKLLRSGAASGVDSISVNCIDADFDGIEKSVSPRRFHLIIVALAAFHRIVTHKARQKFIGSIGNLLLPDGRCIINLLPEKDLVFPKHQISFTVDENHGFEPSPIVETQRYPHTTMLPAESGRYRSSWRSEMMRSRRELNYFQLTYNNIQVDPCDDEFEISDTDPTQFSRSCHNPEKIITTTFTLQNIKETDQSTGACGRRQVQSFCSMCQRTVNVGRLLEMITKEDLEVIEMFDTFRKALCRQRSTDPESAKVIVIGRKKRQHLPPSTIRTFR